ncbi:MAG: hypothetical protein U0359_38520 [Byssovorax sp.]
MQRPRARDAACARGEGLDEPRILADRVDGRPWLGALAASASAAGAGPLQILGADVASEGDRLGAFVEIPEADCLLAFSRASPSIVDADLFAYDDDGSTFAADESPEPEAAILICPPHPRRLYIASRVMAGSGVMSVGIQRVPQGVADAVARAAGVRGRPGEDSGRLDAWPGLEAKIRAHRSSIGAHWDDVRRVAVPMSPHAPTRISATIEPGRCLDILGCPSDEIGTFELVAEDAEGRIISRGREHGRDRSMVLCAATSTPITIAARPRSSQGLLAITIGRSAVGALPEIQAKVRVVQVSQSLDLDGARKALDQDLAGKAYAAAKSVGTGTATTGGRASLSVALPSGCARIDVLAGKPLADLSAQLWDDKGLLLAEARGGSSAPLFACGKGGAARVDVEALESPGPFAIELRRDKSAPAVLTAHPIGAARLLGRMSAGEGPADASDADRAQTITLEPGVLKVFPLTVPRSTCTEVIAAADTGGSGLDLRLVDRGSGDSSLSRSRYVVSDRLCAGAEAISGVYELKIATGKTEVLVLTRTVRDTK